LAIDNPLAELTQVFRDLCIGYISYDITSDVIEEGIFRDEYDAVIISPGPGLPHESAFLNEAIEFYHTKIPILGICLGLQAIVEFYGGSLKQLPTVFHGIRDKIYLLDEQRESPLFKNIPNTFYAGRYHSWVGAQNNFPESLVISATDSNGEIMAIENVSHNVFAFQFHPESYMTEFGHEMIQNFINLSANKNLADPMLGVSWKS
jgi:anthranilate synthase component 2